ncbi:hypothetical protein D1227_15295 [Henriciella mobilis]|uniref:hypothetical protein n=1 Tax=Henriciella mobilis TaxID=2305467 RepID=UPI000E66EC79|nr:hypothetical protein [Henriciella mobilis]RIJ14410.1 hypothetical protein D1231_16745 [Henriciella mobilis]RIJ19762.1 hypothetical protein D1227_15295 [Henriciella mobilis]
MSARNKYIVAAVAAVAVIGGGAAVAYYSNTRTAPEPLVTEQVEDAAGLDLAELEASVEAEAVAVETIVDAADETLAADETIASDILTDTVTAQPETLPAEVQPE